VLDPKNIVLHFDNTTRVAVAIRRGEQYAEVGEYNEALKEYQKALEVTRNSSLAHYRVGELFFLQPELAAGRQRVPRALTGDLEPKWTEVWAHINLGKIFDISDQRDRAVNEYRQALRTKIIRRARSKRPGSTSTRSSCGPGTPIKFAPS